jgi:hypothetical protein
MVQIPIYGPQKIDIDDFMKETDELIDKLNNEKTGEKMFVETMNGSIVEMGVSDAPPTGPIKEEMTYEKRWVELKRQVKIELDKIKKCGEVTEDIFDGTMDTTALKALNLAYHKVFATMEGLEKK